MSCTVNTRNRSVFEEYGYFGQQIFLMQEFEFKGDHTGP